MIKSLLLEKLQEEQEEVQKDIYTNALEKNEFLTPEFLSALNALILTVSNKPEAVVKSKTLLKSILRIVSQVAEIDNIAVFYKKKRHLKLFTKIIKDLNKMPEAKATLDGVLPLICFIFAKIGIRRGTKLTRNLQRLHV